MTTEKAMTITPGSGQIGVFDPEAQLDMAIRAAKVLAKVIAQKKKPVIINGEQYLEFEDWQTLGQFDGVSVKTGDAEPVEIDGVKGAKAKAYLFNNKTGEVIGGAEAYCMRDEEKWGTRPKYEYEDNRRIKVGDEIVPWFQLASMAQTRAASKALRNKEAWIAVLAGYKPTPAEEMTGHETLNEPTAEHWCQEHNTAWFKRGRMNAYAHPIGNTGKWCNEKDASKPPVDAATGEILDGQEPPEATASPAPNLTAIDREDGPQVGQEAPPPMAAATQAQAVPPQGKVMTSTEFWLKARELGYDDATKTELTLGKTVPRWLRDGGTYRTALIALQAAQAKGKEG